jgi:hypothetical protein
MEGGTIGRHLSRVPILKRVNLSVRSRTLTSNGPKRLERTPDSIRGLKGLNWRKLTARIYTVFYRQINRLHRATRRKSDRSARSSLSLSFPPRL